MIQDTDYAVFSLDSYNDIEKLPPDLSGYGDSLLNS